MSKSRQKNHSEIEHLKGKIKEQEKLIRSLQKQLKQLEKREHLVEDSIQDTEYSRDTEDTYRELPKAIRCDSVDGCGKGILEEYEILGKVIGTCNVCGFRKRIK